MFQVIDKTVYAMAGVRVISSLIEMSGAMVMLWAGSADRALQVNAVLALVGPLVLITVTLLGLSGYSGELNWWKMVWVVVGVGCILYGTRG